MTTYQLDGVIARAVDQSLSIGLAAIEKFADHPQVQQLGSLLMAFVFAATLGRSLGIGR